MRISLSGGGLILFVLLWVPPLIDQVTGQPGNITKLWRFFTAGGSPRHPYHEAASVLGRLFEVLPFGQLPQLNEDNWSVIAPDRELAIAVVLLSAAGLALLGTMLRDRYSQSLGVLLVVAVPVVGLSISHVVGPIYPYLLLWVTALPLALAIGWSTLVLVRPPWARWARPLPGAIRRWGSVALITGLVVAIGVLIVARSIDYQRLGPVADDQYCPETRNAWNLTQAALASQTRQPVLVSIPTVYRWPLAAGVSLRLMKAGWKVSVTDDYVFVFGEPQESTGDERLELIFVDPKDVATVTAEKPDLELVGHTDNTYIFMRHISRGTPP
jgi:hypothetical protein